MIYKMNRSTKLIISILLISVSILSTEVSSKFADEATTTEDHSSQIDSPSSLLGGGHQKADPEYIKRELRDIAKRFVDKDDDGHVSYEELKNYLSDMHDKNIDYNVDKQWSVYQPQIHEVFSWEGYEPEKKEVLTWDHYYNQTYPELEGIDVGIPIHREQDTANILAPPEDQENTTEKNRDGETKAAQTEANTNDENSDDPHLQAMKQMVRRADARWKLADENGDTLLTKQEFKFLLHPDEGHEGLKELFIKEATEDMDLNKDNKICLDEFMKHLLVLASDKEKTDQNWLSSQQENFGRFLDKNKDGILDEEEIKDWLVPSKSARYASEAKRLLDIGDINEDHKLSNAELMEHYEHFLGLFPPDYWKSVSELEPAVPRATSDPNHDEL